MLYDIQISKNQYVSANPDKALEYFEQGYQVTMDGKEVTKDSIIGNMENNSVGVITSGN